MKQKMYSFIAHPLEGEYIEHSLLDDGRPLLSLEEMLAAYTNFLAAIGFELDGRELTVVDIEEWEAEGVRVPHLTDSIWRD